MLLAISGLEGYAVVSSDGDIGSVRDILFDDQTWNIRWLVIDTGKWLSTRKVLIHPSAVEHIDYQSETIRFDLTKAKIESSPDLSSDEPVSRQIENHIYNYYGWDPYWSGSYFGRNVSGMSLGSYGLSKASTDYDRRDIIPDDSGDPRLRSSSTVTGYNITATDGGVGHIENFLFDDESWDIRYLIVDTKNWWPGKHVLLSPYSVHDINGTDHQINVAVTREQVKASPPWEPGKLIVQAYEEGLHRHYGWPGYGWPNYKSSRPLVA